MTVELARVVRFCINPADGELAWIETSSPRHNSFAGWPTMAGVGAYYELEVACRGEPNPQTGYLLNISAIDQAVRDHALPVISRQLHREPMTSPGRILAAIMPLLQKKLHQSVAWARWKLTPYYSVSMSAASPQQVSISQQFEFAAAHRLNVESLSAEENRKTFGKCNNPNGHGHNYRIEPTVAVPLNPPADHHSFGLHDLERIVDQVIIQRFDHKHLNLDTAEFAQLNPSVENIARVCHDLLAGPLKQAGAALQRVTVWETEKTRCTYPG